MHKEIREIIKEAERQGWRAKPLTSGHTFMLAPDGEGTVTPPGTPSDYRGLKNALSDEAAWVPVAAKGEMRVMEYTVDVGAQAGALTRDELLGDRLLTALEELEARQQLAGPTTGANMATGIVSATFCVSASDAGAAAVVAAVAFRAALRAAGAPDDHLVEIQVTEHHEEAAAAV